LIVGARPLIKPQAIKQRANEMVATVKCILYCTTSFEEEEFRSFSHM
jgi:hypothetical protein